jgi:hypothetical protein
MLLILAMKRALAFWLQKLLKFARPDGPWSIFSTRDSPSAANSGNGGGGYLTEEVVRDGVWDFLEGYEGRYTATGSGEEQGLYLVTRKIKTKVCYTKRLISIWASDI